MKQNVVPKYIHNLKYYTIFYTRGLQSFFIREPYAKLKELSGTKVYKHILNFTEI